MASPPIGTTRASNDRRADSSRTGSTTGGAVFPQHVEAVHALVVAGWSVSARGYLRAARVAPCQRLRRRRAGVALAILARECGTGHRMARSGMVGADFIHQAGG